jgi:UDP-GlcNAc3NAcA epimerase
MLVTSIIGARPQFVKAAVVTREMARAGVDEVMIHTGQHYDEDMSAVFFDELGINEPAVNLQVGSGSQAVQTGNMMIGLEDYLTSISRPDWVLVYGDTNSTIAGAIVAAKLNLRLAHVEAGLRSFNRRMPEEVNRVVTDRLSSLLFCPTPTAVENLRREGMTEGVHLTGDVMLDATRLFSEGAERPLSQLTDQRDGEYFLATIHRAENTDNPERLQGILEGLRRVDKPVLLPLHPRTKIRLIELSVPPNVHVIQPVGYISMLTLVKHSRGVLTDSGGLQKEALWLGKPCITLRDETEWLETLERGWNQVVGADPEKIAEAAARPPQHPVPEFAFPGAGRRIVDILTAN